MKIFITGYMGAGKSTIGKMLARKYAADFIDLDTEIEKRHKKTINAIFEEEGEETFRRYEQQALEEIFGHDSLIIATGGGTPCFFDNMDKINENGISIYLKLSAEQLVERLKKAGEKRPLIKDKTEEELKIFIKEMLKKRSPFYEKAHITFDNNRSPKEAIDEINLLLNTTFR